MAPYPAWISGPGQRFLLNLSDLLITHSLSMQGGSKIHMINHTILIKLVKRLLKDLKSSKCISYKLICFLSSSKALLTYNNMNQKSFDYMWTLDQLNFLNPPRKVAWSKETWWTPASYVHLCQEYTNVYKLYSICATCFSLLSCFNNYPKY